MSGGDRPRSGMPRLGGALLVWVATGSGCEERPTWTERERELIASLAAPEGFPPPVPRPTNAVADDPRAAALGARIFEDPGFSAAGDVACATCHVPSRHFTDGKPVAVAAGTGKRNTPSIETAAWQTWFFWDGRADSAWAQATGPIRNPLEMAATPELVHAHVRDAYAADWDAVFGGVGDDPARTLAQVGKALEAYERTISPGASRFDRWAGALAAGEDTDLLSEAEKRGLRLFVGRAACVDCHNGPLLTDHEFHVLGLPVNPTLGVDPGRMDGAREVYEDPYNCRGAYADPSPAGEDPCAELRYLDPDFPDWNGAFKTPSLRNVGRTEPYMHDGAFPTLEAVLAFYNTLPGEPPKGQHREKIPLPLHRSGEELAALAAFLRALESVDPAP